MPYYRDPRNRDGDNNTRHRGGDEYRDRRDRDRGGYEDHRGSSSRHARDPRPGGYDAEYESRKLRDRREREYHEKHGRRSRSRDQHEEGRSDRDRDRRDHDRDRRNYEENRSSRREREQYSTSDDSSRDTETRRQPRRSEYDQRRREEEELPKEATSSFSNADPRPQNSETEYLATLSNAKLQETYDRYENDPNFDITDGLLDNIVIDKEKIHEEMQERLRQHLLAEGKVYPPKPKPEPQQTTIFANDGSFMDMFKKMQEQQMNNSTIAAAAASSSSSSALLGSGVTAAVATTEVKRPQAPMYGKRRGGKILKTGIVEKKRPIEDASAEATPGDAWSQYMKEVKRYKSVSCDVDNKTRPLVK